MGVLGGSKPALLLNKYNFLYKKTKHRTFQADFISMGLTGPRIKATVYVDVRCHTLICFQLTPL